MIGPPNNTDFKQQRTSFGEFFGGPKVLSLHIASCQLAKKNDVRKNYSTRFIIHLAWLVPTLALKYSRATIKFGQDTSLHRRTNLKHYK